MIEQFSIIISSNELNQINFPKKMGCQSSLISSQTALSLRVNILDSSFMKNNNEQIREKMKSLQINYDVYFTIDTLIHDMEKLYTNQIIVMEDKVQKLIEGLKKHNYHPNIRVVLMRGIQEERMNSYKDIRQKYQNVSFYQNYQEIIRSFQQKNQSNRRMSTNPEFKQKNQEQISLKIFQNLTEKSSQIMIFEQTLKSKSIEYKKYNTFNELEQSMFSRNSKFILTDYVYHREVLNLTQKYKNEKNPIKVICYCNGEEKFDSRLYFLTNNFLQVVKQIQSEQKLKNLISIKCSKAFVYAKESSAYLLDYLGLIEYFDFEVKVAGTLEKIVKESKYYFAVTIIINPEDRKQVEKYLEENQYSFKTKIIDIKKGTANSVIGLRKAIKQLKKGYKTQKNRTRSIDIIDKHFNDTKFMGIKKQLEKNHIKLYGYESLTAYIKTKKFISPYIISNFQQRSLLTRYLNQVKFKSRVIIFCNKNQINQTLTKNKNFAFISHHFGKIIKYVKKNHIYNPYIVDENDNRIQERILNLKNKNKRISALNWSGIKQAQQNGDVLEKEFQFLNISGDTNASQIRDIQRQSAGLFKLDYLPANNKNRFIKDLTESIRKLSHLFKINYPEGELQKLLNQISQMNLEGLLRKVREFFSSRNQLGRRINKSLIDISVLSKEQLTSMKQLLFLINLNYLSVYTPRYIQKVRMYHYIQSQLIQKCQVGSLLMNKNYQVFYEKQNQSEITQEDKIAKYMIELELEYITLSENDLEMNSFFVYDGKYVFAPLSQFLIKEIRMMGDIMVVNVQYRRNVDYLKAYFEDNFGKTNILDFYQRQLQIVQAQSVADSSLLLVDKENVQKVKKNIHRVETFKLFKGQHYDKAIERQIQTINQEQSEQNFDSGKLQSLNYELACFYFKSSRHQECRKLVKQLLDSEPVAFLKQKIKIIDGFYENKQEKQNNLNENEKNQEIFKIITLNQDYDCDQTEEMRSEESSQDERQREENIFDTRHLQNEIACIDLERIDFQEYEKENIE